MSTGEKGPVIAGYELIGPLPGHGGGQLVVACPVSQPSITGVLSNPDGLVVVRPLPRAAALRARETTSLRHPNLVAILDVVEEDGQWLEVREHLSGRDLKTVLDEYRRGADDAMPAALAAHLTAEMCRGLAHAHLHGLAHRALTTRNVVLTFDGGVKVADVGTLAPRRDGDARAADVVAVGAMLYQMLAGRAPLGTVTPPSQIHSSVHSVLESLCMRALAAAEVPGSMSAASLANELEQFLSLIDAETQSGGAERVAELLRFLFPDDAPPDAPPVAPPFAPCEVSPAPSLAPSPPQQPVRVPESVTEVFHRPVHTPAADGPLLVEVGGVIGGRYRVEEPLGSGGAGDVFRAVDTWRQRSIALKVVHFDDGPLSDEARFAVEVAALMRVPPHANVVRYVDHGRLPQRTGFLCMSLVDGRTLGEVLRERGRLPWQEATVLVRGIAAGLAAVHAVGLIHRDLKPANVLVVEDGAKEGAERHPVVVDFGICTETQATARATRIGQVVGTAEYAAPERYTDGATVDERCDLYSLGCIWFELVTGRRPFEGRGPAAVLAHHHATPPSPMSCLPFGALPRAVDDAILRLLHKRPEERFASARALLDAIDAFDAPKTATVPRRAGDPASAPARPRWFQRLFPR